MDIHKPKPIHNWRDFLKEVGIIVLGVSIALGGEQMVEKWREHRQYVEARQAMRDELGFDIFNISRRRSELTPCIVRRLQEIDGLLNQADQGKSFAAESWIGDAASYRLRYNAEPEAGRSGLFTTVEQAQFGTLYGWLHSIDVEQDRERQAWGRLRALEGRAQLSPELASQMRIAQAEARFEHNRLELLIALLREGARNWDITPANRGRIMSAPPETMPLCLPMNTPPEEAARRSLYPAQR